MEAEVLDAEFVEEVEPAFAKIQATKPLMDQIKIQKLRVLPQF